MVVVIPRDMEHNSRTVTGTIEEVMATETMDTSCLSLNLSSLSSTSRLTGAATATSNNSRDTATISREEMEALTQASVITKSLRLRRTLSTTEVTATARISNLTTISSLSRALTTEVTVIRCSVSSLSSHKEEDYRRKHSWLNMISRLTLCRMKLTTTLT